MKVIEEIRRDEFGIGLETDKYARAVINKQNERLNRALEELSEGLYSKETHFIMELIQNADDNKYKSDSPMVIFIYDTEKMIIKNNEVGFTDDDVKAICDVGRSNKKKNSGCIYIGEKGIGFKSVFKITNKPQIYSNCFRFEFKRKDIQDKLGFVVPYLVEHKPDFIDENETTIVLPFNEEFGIEITKFEAAKDPMLLIFLNKIIKLEIYDKVKNESHCFEKINEMSGSLIIKHNINGIEEKRFVWRKKDFWINMEDIEEEKRKDIQNSRIILAFPLNDDGTPKISFQKMFAFLPIEQSPEFKFVIQADFILISNREDIIRYKPWNQRIRDNISSAFIDSLIIFKNDEKLKNTWYRYIPKENEIRNDFFKSVVTEIYEKLKHVDCILSDSGTWVRPEDAILAPSEIQLLIPAKINGRQHYVHSEIKEDVKDILEELGVKVQKGYSLLLAALKDNDFLKSRDNEWFNNLYEFLNEKLFIKKEWQDKEISNLPIIIAEDGSLEIPSKLFFKPANEQLKEYENIPVIKYVDLNGISKNGKEFLEKIGVNDSHSLEKIKKRIIEAYKSDECESWNYEQHRNCSKHIEAWLNEKKWDISDSEKDELGFIRVQTENEWIPANECYFPDEELKKILPENVFFIKLLKNDDAERRFLRTIGVWSIPRIIIKQEISIQNTHEISDVEKYAEWLDKNGKRDKDADDEQWSIHILEGFENCIYRKDKQVSTIILAFLIENWNNYYSDFIDSDYEVFYKNNPVSTKPIQVPSYFTYKIKQAEWLPTNRGFKKPESGVFRSFEKIKKFSSDFPFLEIEKELLDKGKEFLDFLELATEPNLNTLLNILSNIRNRDDKNLVFEIYRKIASELDNAGKNEIKNPNKDLRLLSTDGNFYPIQELYWNDHPKSESFKNVHFVYIPEELSGYDKKLLFEDFFEIKRVSTSIESVLDKVNPDNEESPDWTKRLKDRSHFIRDIFSYNDIKNPDEFFKKDIRVYLADEIHVHHELFQYTTHPENVEVYCDDFTGKIYKKRDADELDLALGIEESVGGKNIAMYIKSVLELSEPTSIQDLLTRCGIKLISEKHFTEKNKVVGAEEHEETEQTQDEIGYPETKESLAERVKRAYHESEQVSSSMDDFNSQKQKWDYDNLDINNIEADISSEIKHSKKRRKISSLLIERKKVVTEKVKQWYGHKCQICGESFETKGGNLYAEGHHFIPIGDEKECEDIDNLGNVLCVCPKCHKMMHQGKWKSIGIDSNTKVWSFNKDKEGFFHLDLVFYGIFEKYNFLPEKNTYIKYNEEHLKHLKKFLETHGNKDKIVVDGEYL